MRCLLILLALTPAYADTVVVDTGDRLNLVQNGRYRVEYDSGAAIPLIAGFTWNVNLFDRYDNKPPRDDLERNDYGMVSTFGFTF